MLAWCDNDRAHLRRQPRGTCGGVRGQKARFEAMCGDTEASALPADEAPIEITEHADLAMAERATSRRIIDAFVIGDCIGPAAVVRWSS
jgi:hypothetical protein